MRQFLAKILREFPKLQLIPRAILESHDLHLAQHRCEKLATLPNKFNLYGKKFFSQSDEDGLTLEIIRRLKIESGTFLEFGVGDGLENNTIILLASGWKGVWVGGNSLSFHMRPEQAKLKYINQWVTLKNLKDICGESREFLGKNPDLVSMDFDGNDLLFVEQILKCGLLPKVFICEFNGKFPLPIKFSVTYDHFHKWNHDDYFGSSLGSFIDLLERFGYFLVVVNGFTGVNAFFVLNEYRSLFPDIPDTDEKKWVDPMYVLDKNFLHPTSPKTISTIVND